MSRKLSGLVFAAAFAAAALCMRSNPQPPPRRPARASPRPPSSRGAARRSADGSSAPTITVSVNEVNLIFTVTDKHGHYIPNLQQSDFALLDDQKAPAKVNSFHQQINLPLRVGIVIDASTSIRSRFQFEQQSATEFLLEILKAKSDRAFVMGFDVTPTVTQDWTNNIDALETGVNRLRPGGGTALFDAVYTACRDKLLDESRGQEPVRKAIVLISDGDDNQSRVYQDEAIKECQRAETIIYAISTNWTPSRGKGDQVLTTDGRGDRRAGLLSAFGRGDVQQLPQHRRRAAQPVCADLHSGRFQGERRVPSHLSLLQRPALPGAHAQGILRAEAVRRTSPFHGFTVNRGVGVPGGGKNRAESLDVALPLDLFPHSTMVRHPSPI